MFSKDEFIPDGISLQCINSKDFLHVTSPRDERYITFETTSYIDVETTHSYFVNLPHEHVKYLIKYLESCIK